MENVIIRQMIDYFKNDIRRINHALKVYSFSKVIADGERLTDNEKQPLIYAAILHDIGIKVAEEKYNSNAGNYQELEGPPIARSLLSTSGFETGLLDRICFLIGNHHSYHKIDGIDFQILVEADFIVNIDEDKMPKHTVLKIRENIFKTQTGTSLFDLFYL